MEGVVIPLLEFGRDKRNDRSDARRGAHQVWQLRRFVSQFPHPHERRWRLLLHVLGRRLGCKQQGEQVALVKASLGMLPLKSLQHVHQKRHEWMHPGRLVSVQIINNEQCGEALPRLHQVVVDHDDHG